MTIRLFYVLLPLALLVANSTCWAQQTRFKVLAFYSDHTEPDHVHFAQDAVKFLSERAAAENFTFEATTKWEDLSDERLKAYQLLIWLNESPTKSEQRSAFERYMQSGGTWLGFHAAGYNDDDTQWPWFVDFLGGAVFSINSWPPLPASLVVDNRLHPVTSGITDFESPANEWYVWKPSPRLNKDVRVLATLDPSNYPIGFKDVLTSGDLPVIWTNTKYKMLYMNMGHGDKIFTSPTQNQLIVNAVNWLGTNARQGATLEPKGMRISPSGIVLNPQSGKFYAVDTGRDTVNVLDGNGHLLTHLPVGHQPESIAINPDTNRIYVANSGSGTVSVVDGATDSMIATVPVGDLPYTITVNQATNKIFVSRTFSDVTVIIDGAKNTARSIKAGVGDAVAAESLGAKVYLINYESPKITVFDASNERITEIAAPNHLWAIVANAAAGKVYAVSAGSPDVTVIDGKSRTTKAVKAGEIPCAVAVDSNSGRVFVANYVSKSVTVIEGSGNSVVGTVDVGSRPQVIAVDSSSHKVYVVSTHAGTITVLDGTNLTVLRTIKAGKTPYAIAVNDKTHKAVAVFLEGDLAVIDGTTLATSSPLTSSDGQ